MTINGSGIRDTSRALGINKKTVIIILEKKESALIQVNSNIHKMAVDSDSNIHIGLVFQEAEIDEQWSYVDKNQISVGFGMLLIMQQIQFLLMCLERERMKPSKNLKHFLSPLVLKSFSRMIGDLTIVILMKKSMKSEKEILKR